MIQNTVAGRVTNVYSKNDQALQAFKLTNGQKPIGREPYYVDTRCNLSCDAKAAKKFRFDNIEVTSIF